ncbi:hypothetical protein JL100_019525 [Skermanella mucosa]|uniref:hypothetical protein n=1 Tax=Skermanella mucosa TaxID=1789672 RepID=UPI00192C92F9|nr:hypothetical protein [Skermanella mucosa]UEM19273.1 hypothetical protein JL100_019525 [Skermanella mucosa]
MTRYRFRFLAVAALLVPFGGLPGASARAEAPPAIVLAEPPGPVADLTIAGHIDRIEIGPEIVMEGWGLLSSAFPASGAGLPGSVRIHSDLDIRGIAARRVERPDVVAAVGKPDLLFSGFVITLVPTRAVPPGGFTLCVTTDDPLYGRFRMHDNPQVPCSLNQK